MQDKLTKLGQEVFNISFPVDEYDKMKPGEPTKENLESWMQTFETEILPNLNASEKICFIAHSISCVFVLHILAKHKLKLDSAIVVSPFYESIDTLPMQFLEVNKSFYKTDFDFAGLAQQITTPYVLSGDNDPYVPMEFMKNFAEKLGAKQIVINNGGHLSAGAGFLKFGLVYELCLTRLDKEVYINTID